MREPPNLHPARIRVRRRNSLTIVSAFSRTAGSQLKQNAAAQSIQCKVCMATFICTTAEVKLKEHADNKHPKNDFYQCFPHLKA